MKFELDINNEVVDQLVNSVLLDQYDSLVNDVRVLQYHLKENGTLPDHKQADLDYDLDMLIHLKKVMHHNGVTPADE